MQSPKFRVGVDFGRPKRTKLNLSGEYNSSVGSHDLPGDADEAPQPIPRRRRPVEKKMAMRMSRGASSGSPEVQFAAPSTQPSVALTHLARIQAHKNLFEVIHKWNAATDPKHNDFLESLIHDMRCEFGLTPPPGVLLGELLGFPMPPGMAKGTLESASPSARLLLYCG